MPEQQLEARLNLTLLPATLALKGESHEGLCSTPDEKPPHLSSRRDCRRIRCEARLGQNLRRWIGGCPGCEASLMEEEAISPVPGNATGSSDNWPKHYILAQRHHP